MQDLMLSAVSYGGYISILKFIVFLILFFLWLPLVTWVCRDALAVETNEKLWTGVVLAVGAAMLIVWLLVPIFIIGVLLYVIGVGTAALAYVKHRNVRVLDIDRVLTVDHIKSLFASRQKKLEALKSFTFVTANKNEVPLPQPRTPDFFGYKIAYDMLNDAMWRRASDVIFAPGPQQYNITYYVDGAALKQPSVPRDQTEYLIRFLKNLGDLDIKEKRKPQKGMFRINRSEDSIKWEIVTAGSTAGEQVRLKQILRSEVTRLAEIGLMQDQYEQLSRFKTTPQGLFLVSGPKKSGVTTTLYAMLRNHDAFINSINTLERKPPGDLPNVTQNIFKPGGNGAAAYSEVLRTTIRMGPDIVGVGECEDAETAKVACWGAGDGKIIYVAIEADSVIQALSRWMRLVGDRKLVAKTLLGISNQRLLRKLCEQCRQAYAPNEELFRKFNIPEKAKLLYRAGKVQYDKHGKPSTCENCQGTGFVGRTGVFETIILNDELKKVVRTAKSMPEISAEFRRAKMRYVQERALMKVIAGDTSINEMIRGLSPKKKAKKA